MRLILVALTIAAAFLSGLAFAHAIGFLPAGLYTADYLFLSEGAQRIALGQTPYVDFSAPVGPLVFWLLAEARRLPFLGPDIFALDLLMWAVAAVPAGLVAARLRSPSAALAVLAIAAVVVLAPFNLEEMNNICEVNYNGTYNRYGAALLFITFVAGFTRPRNLFCDGVLFAWLIGAMLLTKVTYGVAALAFLATAALFSRARLGALATALAVLGLGTVALQVSTGMVSAYATDLAAMARLNSGQVLAHLQGALWGSTLVVIAGLALVAVLAVEPLHAAGPALHWRKPWDALAALKLPALAGACFALTLWTESQSTGGPGFIGFSALAFAPAFAVGRWGALKAGLAIGVVLLSVGLFADQVLRRGWCLLEEVPDYRPHPAVSALVPGFRATPGRLAAAEFTARLWREDRPLADEAYRDGFAFNLESYGAPVSFLADAMVAYEAAERLRALGLGRNLKHVMTLAFVDDFTPLLGLTPPPGTKLALDPYRTVGPLTAEEARSYMRSVDAAFERTCAAPPYMGEIVAFFRPVLEEAFDPVVLTPCWTVHLRRGAGLRP